MDIIQLILSLGTAGFIIQLLVFVYNTLKIGAKLKEGGKVAGNAMGLLYYNNLVVKIKDETTRQLAIKEAMELDNAFSEGWDKGVQGIKI